jgi:hypothetical protein
MADHIWSIGELLEAALAVARRLRLRLRRSGDDGSVRWSHFLGQPAKVGSSMRMTDHEDAETVFV